MLRLFILLFTMVALPCISYAGHTAAVGQGSCSFCHRTNLITQHGGFQAGVCQRCHNSAAAAVFGTISSGNAGLAYTCGSCHGSQSHLAKHGDYLYNWSKYSGVNPVSASPWTQGTFTNVSPATKQFQLCMKCHSSNGFGNTAAGVSGIVGPSGINLTDTAMEFNPQNVSFHPILASAGSNRGATSNIKAPWTRTSIMTCGDCHDADPNTDPNGPHATAAKFLLKGPNTVWNNTIQLGRTTTGIFCANCHDMSWRNSRFPGHSEGDHDGIPCFNCHVAIPHGSQRMGLLISPAGYASTVGAAPITDKAPYNQATGGAGRGLYIKSYPSATGSWVESNCGCDGTQHD